DLEPAEAGTLAARLAENALPGNAAYDYDYFRDNCSTRVRDALDEALGGLLGAHMHGRSRGNTYRSEAVRLARPDPLMALGFDLEPAEAGTLAARLAENALPGNAAYDYDYFRDNCSTRVRDALDEALGGLLGAHMHGRSRGNTYRSEAVRLARPDPLMALGFD